MATGTCDPELRRFPPKVAAADLVPGADSFGPIRPDVPAAPVLRQGEIVGWALPTSGMVGTTGYSGEPIHVVVGISPEAVLTRVRLVEHAGPIVLIGIPEPKKMCLTEGYAEVDLKAEAAAGGSVHELDIISGATVTIMIIDKAHLGTLVFAASVGFRISGLAAGAAGGVRTESITALERLI